MKKLRNILLFTLLMAFASSAAWAEIKIGFVEMTALMESAPQAKRATEQIEAEFEPRHKELGDVEKRIKKLEEKLVRDGAVMSEEERTKQDRDIRSQKRELQRMREEFQEDLNIRRNEEIGKLQRNLLSAIEALAKEEEYDLILYESGAMFRSERIDITKKVLERLKQGISSSAE
ncbi:MAG: OmpH family outer membrane protein [Gammaproteobacteria bacterium]